MKTFKALAMVKQPRQDVWSLVRDRLVDLVPLLDDVRGITVESRADDADGTVRLVNVWRAKAEIPALLRSVVKPEMLTWTDRAVWQPDAWECRWEIQPHFMGEATECTGVTRYEEAMGGRGTRLVFEGTFNVLPARLPGVTSLIGGPTARGIEAFVTALVPKNFQKLAKAADAHLASPFWSADPAP